MDTIDEMLLPHVGWLRFEAGDEVATFLRQGWFEAAEQAMLWLYGRPGDIVLDIGAHVGLFSALARRVVLPGGRILAIEPAVTTAQLLRQNTEGEATILQAAIGQQVGRMVLQSAGSGRSAYNTLGSERSDNGTEVDVITLDQLLQDHGIERADFVKLDVEGAELAVWRGAQQAIEQRRLEVVMIEFTDPNLVRAGTSSEELFRTVSDSGYRLYRFDIDTQQLVPAQFTEPIWYENLFATTNIDAVNARLRDAPEDRRRIAADILARGRAGLVARDAPAIEQRIEVLKQERDALHTALEKVRHDLQEQIALRDQSYAAHEKTAGELRQTQNWLKTTTQRAEQAEAHITQLRQELHEAHARITQLEQQLLEFCTSNYVQFAWRIGLRRKPEWVDAFIAAHQPRTPGNTSTQANPAERES